MAKRSKRHSGVTPTRSIRVPDKFWHNWAIAAKIAGIDRNKFLITVVNHAAGQIIHDSKVLEEQAQEEDKDG